jgi:glutamate racemase
MKIGIFDSGVGGLTVLHEARRALPGAHYLYYADTAHVPYGTKPKEEVKGYVFEAVRFLVAQGCEAVVIACNTATSVAIEDLRAAFALPIIGMEPAVKPAVEAHDDKRVLVFATELTLREPKFHNLVARVDNEGVVDYLSMQELVMFAERFDFSDATVLPYLRRRLAGIDPAAYGHVVLGCTHFIYFRSQIQALFPPDTVILDGNAGTVQHLRNRVPSGFPADEAGITCYSSSPTLDPTVFRSYLDRLEEPAARPPAVGPNGG